MSWWELLLVPLGAAVGGYGTLVGAGGGFVLVPALLLLYPDEDPAAITSISLAVVFVNALSGSAAYARLHRIDVRSGLYFAAASLPGAVAGALLVQYVPRRAFDVIFGVLLLSIAAYTWWSVGRPQVMRPPLRGRGVVTRVMPGTDEGQVFRYSFVLWHGMAFAAGIGLLSSLLGIGGGVFHVPVMIAVLRFPVHVAVATSQFVLAFMSGEGAAVHLATGELGGENLVRAALIALGAIPGAQLGARMAQRVRGTMIARLLVLALVLVGGRLLAAAFV
ncbi:MAG TPA: sulfite exporter TauE/SafE family protein [Dehalococcoidia bacterium]|nr:sulfite exporter TauE/SafE family protein [Dehalococcoidia bacterium]